MADEIRQGTDPFDVELEALTRALAEVPADRAPRSVSNPTQTLSGRRMEGRRPMTVQEQTMLENPALQMGRDAGAFASSAVNSLGLGVPGIVVDYVAPNVLAGIRENEELANAGVPFAGSMAGGALAPYNRLAQGVETVGRGIAYAPKTAATVLGAGGFLGTSTDTGETQSRGQATDETRALQQRLRDAGYYTGPIDGITGNATQAAREKFEAAEQSRGAQQLERLRVEAEQSRSAAERQRAEAAIAETQRQQAALEEETRRRTEGEDRLRQMEQDVPIARRILREYGPTVGWAGGIALGVGAKGLINHAYNARSAAAATRANALLAEEGGDMASRVGRVNQFWGEGQRPGLRAGGAEVPFVASPGSKPPFRSNPDAPSSGDLYQTGRFADPTTDLTVAGAFAGEAALSYAGLQEAQSELSSARQAAEGDPSEMNLRRLQAALDQTAIFQAAFNAGRLGGPIYLGSGGKMQRQPSRPDVSPADAERLRIEQYLNQRASRGQARPTQEGTIGPARETSSMPETASTARYESRPTPEPETAARSTRPRSRPTSQTRLSPDDLPEGHTFNPKGKGSKVQGPNGKFATMPNSTPGGRSVQIDDTRPYGFRRNALDPED